MEAELSERTRVRSNALTFSILAKHLLPKAVLDNITNEFLTLISGEMTTNDFIKSMCNQLENYKSVNIAWLTIIDRKTSRKNALYADIFRIVSHLMLYGVPDSYIFSFVYFIINTAMQSDALIKLFTNILTIPFFKNYPGISVPHLLSIALRIHSYIKYNPNPPRPKYVENVKEMIPFNSKERKPRIRSVRLKPGEESQDNESKAETSDDEKDSDSDEERLSESYRKTQYPISPLPTGLIINTNAESVAIGSEGGTEQKTSEFERFLSYIRSFAHLTWELLTTADINSYAFLYHLQCDGILTSDVIMELYGQEAPIVISHLRNHPELKEMIEKRALDLIQPMADHRRRIHDWVDQFTRHFPIFDVRACQLFSDGTSKTFSFDITSMSASFLITELSVFLSKKVHIFMRDFVSLFAEAESSNRDVLLLANDSFANALIFLSNVCQEIEELMSPVADTDGSLDAILERAAIEATKRYGPCSNTRMGAFIIEFMDKFSKNGERFIALCEEAETRLGDRMPAFYRMMVDLEKMSAAAARFVVDRNYGIYLSCARFFGVCPSGPGSRERLEGRIGLSAPKLVPHSMTPLLKVYLDGKAKVLTITPL